MIKGLDIYKNGELLEGKYREYLKEFPLIFKKYNPTQELERNYDRHIENDVSSLVEILRALEIAFCLKDERNIKTHNIHIWSFKSSVGKSRLINHLKENTHILPCQTISSTRTYNNNTYTAFVSDEASEFIKTKSYGHFKKGFDGNDVEFNRKGKHAILKTDNPLILTCDNVHFHFIMKRYHDNNNYTTEVFNTRVLDLEIKSRASIHFLIDRVFDVELSEEVEVVKTKEELLEENKKQKEEMKNQAEEINVLKKQLAGLKYEE